MLPISFARHSSSMPMQHIAFQRLRVCAAVQFRRLSYRCPCFSMHLLFRAALFCAFARPLAANPTQCRSYPSNANAFLRSAIASRCRSFPLQFLALSSLSIAEHSLAAADRSCSVAYRSFALASQCSSELFHCASRLCTARHCSSHLRHSVARLLDAHRCNSSAIRVTAILLLSASVLGQSIAPQSSTLLFHCWS